VTPHRAYHERKRLPKRREAAVIGRHGLKAFSDRWSIRAGSGRVQPSIVTVKAIADDVNMRLDALAPASRRSLTIALDGIVANARKRLASVTVANLKAAKA
jgi:hypothetical protein